MDNNSAITFKYTDEFEGWAKTPQFIEDFIIKNNIKSVFEIGAGANATIPPDVVKRLNISYTINDIEMEELDKADPVYTKNVADLCKDDITGSFNTKYDLIFSRMAGEHFYNAKNLHANVYNLLNEGGYAIHCFATLYTFPFLVNKLSPDWLSDKLLAIFNPRDSYQHKKFKAYYDMSFGPTNKMISFFNTLGYHIVKYTGYYGHSYYNRVPLVRTLEKIKAKWLVKHPIPMLTSYATVILKKGA